MNLQKIKALIEFTGRSSVSKLVVRDRGVTLRIIKSQAAVAAKQDVVPTQADPVTVETGKLVAGADEAVLVAAPMFGLLHRSPNPGARPFVEEGDHVESGQALLIIEAMKVFNTVAAPKAGKITRFMAEDGYEVEAGQSLVEIV